MEHTYNVLFSNNKKTWMSFGRWILAEFLFPRIRVEIMSVADDICTCFQHPWIKDLDGPWSYNMVSWSYILQGDLKIVTGQFFCHHSFLEVLLCGRKRKDQLIWNNLIDGTWISYRGGGGLSCRRWHTTTTLNISTPIHGIRSVAWFCIRGDFFWYQSRHLNNTEVMSAVQHYSALNLRVA